MILDGTSGSELSEPVGLAGCDAAEFLLKAMGSKAMGSDTIFAVITVLVSHKFYP